LPIAVKLKRKMATATPLRISTSEYLRTSYRPDCDYFDATTGLRLDLAALFASIDDALGDPGKR
jgi:hypothetical protein